MDLLAYRKKYGAEVVDGVFTDQRTDELMSEQFGVSHEAKILGSLNQ